MQNRLIFNAELYKWNHSSISCLMLGNVLVLHRESRLCPCFDDLRTEHFTSPNSKQYRDKNIPTTARRTSRCDRAMLARPRQGAASLWHGPGCLAQEESLPVQLCVLHGRSGHHTSQDYVEELPGFTRKKCCFISEGDFHAGATGREGKAPRAAGYPPAAACPLPGGDCSHWCVPQPFPSPAPVLCVVLPAALRLSFVVSYSYKPLPWK